MSILTDIAVDDFVSGGGGQEKGHMFNVRNRVDF